MPKPRVELWGSQKPKQNQHKDLALQALEGGALHSLQVGCLQHGWGQTLLSLHEGIQPETFRLLPEAIRQHTLLHEDITQNSITSC